MTQGIGNNPIPSSPQPLFHMFLISGYLPAARCSFPLPPSWTCRPFFWAEIIACRFQEYLPLFDAILVPPLPWLQSLWKVHGRWTAFGRGYIGHIFIDFKASRDQYLYLLWISTWKYFRFYPVVLLLSPTGKHVSSSPILLILLRLMDKVFQTDQI